MREVELKRVFAKVPATSTHETEFKSTANTHVFKSRKDAGETVKAQLPRGLLSNKIQHNVPIAERFPAHTSLCKYHT